MFARDHDGRSPSAALTVSWAAALTVAVMLSACGGGGGGSTPPPAQTGFQLTFEPGTLSASFYEGEPVTVSVQTRANQAYSTPVQVGCGGRQWRARRRRADQRKLRAAVRRTVATVSFAARRQLQRHA